jgi:hypothetical protein
MYGQQILWLQFYLAPLSFVVLIAAVAILGGRGKKARQVARATPWIILTINAVAWLSNWGFQLDKPYWIVLSIREVWVPLVVLFVTCFYVISQDKGRHFGGEKPSR